MRIITLSTRRCNIYLYKEYYTSTVAGTSFEGMKNEHGSCNDFYVVKGSFIGTINMFFNGFSPTGLTFFVNSFFLCTFIGPWYSVYLECGMVFFRSSMRIAPLCCKASTYCDLQTRLCNRTGPKNTSQPWHKQYFL